jgi:hypothetical protein
MPERITGVIMEITSHFQGKYPDVPFAPGVDHKGLVEGDDDPMFVTLPIGKVDTVSRNGRKYNREAVESIVNTIMNETSKGMQGHLTDSQRSYSYSMPSLYWVGATLESDGMAWGKAYVPKTFPTVREHFRISMKASAEVATSLYGTATVDEDGAVHDLNLESLDLVDPKRRGVEEAGAIPKVTQESVVEEESVEEGNMPPDAIKNGQNNDQSNTPADTPEVQALAEIKRKHRDEVRGLLEQLDENRDKLADYASVAELLGNPKDIVVAAMAWRAEIEYLKRENSQLLWESIKSQVADKVKVEDRRPVIEQLVRDRKPVTRNEVTSALEDVLGQEYVKTLLKSGVQETMGPNQTNPVKPDDKGEQETSSPIIIPKVPAKEAS